MKKKAFTVAELLVAVTIMIILISISFITYTNPIVRKSFFSIQLHCKCFGILAT